MRILGLTGSIGMGKSTAANVFRRARVPVFDADATVHALQSPHGLAIPKLAAAFPGCVVAGKLNRDRLRRQVIGHDAAMQRLEEIMHPLVREQQRRFLARTRAHRARLVLLDIPLLLEGDGQVQVDLVIVVSAPASVQRHRVRARRVLSDAQVDALIGRQMPDAEKRRRADVIIHTGLSRAHANAAIRRLIRRSLAA